MKGTSYGRMGCGMVKPEPQWVHPPAASVQQQSRLIHTRQSCRNDNCEAVHLGEQIGKGSTCFVYAGWSDGKEVAVKRRTVECLKDVFDELLACTRLPPHPNIVYFHKYILVQHGRSFVHQAAVFPPVGVVPNENGEAYIIMDRMECTLGYWIRSHVNVRVVDTVLHDWAVQLHSAVSHMHQHGIVHRDIKLDNLFLQHGQLFLGDLGYAKCVVDLNGNENGNGNGNGNENENGNGNGNEKMNEKMMKSTVGTPFYMAPEIVNSYLYNQTVDLYSAGVTLMKMLLPNEWLIRLQFDAITALWKRSHWDFMLQLLRWNGANTWFVATVEALTRNNPCERSFEPLFLHSENHVYSLVSQPSEQTHFNTVAAAHAPAQQHTAAQRSMSTDEYMRQSDKLIKTQTLWDCPNVPGLLLIRCEQTTGVILQCNFASSSEPICFLDLFDPSSILMWKCLAGFRQNARIHDSAAVLHEIHQLSKKASPVVYFYQHRNKPVRLAQSIYGSTHFRTNDSQMWYDLVFVPYIS